MGFEGHILVNSSLEDAIHPGHNRTEINTGGESVLIEYINDGHVRTHMSKETILFAGSFIFSVQDKELHSEILSKKNDRTVARKSQVDVDSKRLTEESAAHNDILFVETVDVYRNLPRKLLLAHRWLFDNVNIQFVLKIDDDCFVNVPAIIQGLEKIPSSNTWWSCFRDNWYVERMGKWRELLYTSLVYPRFACGSGNIITNDLHRWIAANEYRLKEYQGEDVSMGIWLAAVGPDFFHDRNWKCNRECEPEMYVLPELSPQVMEQMWTNQNDCGNPCKCV